LTASLVDYLEARGLGALDHWTETIKLFQKVVPEIFCKICGVWDVRLDGTRSTV